LYGETISPPSASAVVNFRISSKAIVNVGAEAGDVPKQNFSNRSAGVNTANGGTAIAYVIFAQ